jgi:hypothetical protein
MLVKIKPDKKPNIGFKFISKDIKEKTGHRAEPKSAINMYSINLFFVILLDIKTPNHIDNIDGKFLPKRAKPNIVNTAAKTAPLILTFKNNNKNMLKRERREAFNNVPPTPAIAK